MIKKFSKGKKNLKKGFTLIEFLVVVAIIGVLAAVGVTAFSGFTENAKINAVKTMHANTAKRIAAELQKCTMGATTFFVGARNTTGAAVSQTCSTTATTQATRARTGVVETSTDKNPWAPTLSTGNPNWAIKSANGFEKGFVTIQVSGANITVRALWNDSNVAKYRSQTTVIAE